jgi:hypothetical protein
LAYARRIKLYPLAQAAKPPATTFVDAIDVVYDSTIPYGLRFFQSLDRVVQMEPWLVRDKLMIDMLKSLGIEKGKPFNPDAKTHAILKSAAREAHALLESRYEGMFTPYFDISRWAVPALPDYLKASQDGFSDPNAYPVDNRGLVFTFAFFTPKHLGQGQFYLMTVKDKDGPPGAAGFVNQALFDMLAPRRRRRWLHCRELHWGSVRRGQPTYRQAVHFGVDGAQEAQDRAVKFVVGHTLSLYHGTAQSCKVQHRSDFRLCNLGLQDGAMPAQLGDDTQRVFAMALDTSVYAHARPGENSGRYLKVT